MGVSCMGVGSKALSLGEGVKFYGREAGVVGAGGEDLGGGVVVFGIVDWREAVVGRVGGVAGVGGRERGCGG